MVIWSIIAENLCINPGFIKNKNGSALKSRFDLLMRAFQSQEMESMRKSGATEEFQEREELLTDIKSRVDDWSTDVLAIKCQAQSKKTGIEKSGEVIQRMAIHGQDDCSSVSGESDSGSVQRPKKRQKISKREKLDGLMLTVQRAISDAAQRNEHKDQHDQERLEFERKEAQERLRMEERRLNLQELECTRRAENEKNMFDFLMKMSTVMNKFFGKQ